MQKFELAKVKQIAGGGYLEKALIYEERPVQNTLSLKAEQLPPGYPLFRSGRSSSSLSRKHELCCQLSRHFEGFVEHQSTQTEKFECGEE